jgi:hemoglobin-like flavoprotein
MTFLDTFNRSYERIIGRGVRLTDQSDDFFEDFYQRFVASSPEVAQAFAQTDIPKQLSMLKKSLLFLVSFFATHQANPYLEQVAHRHGAAHINIPSHLYDTWLECLIESVRTFDPDFDDNVELAWRLVLGHGITYMRFMRNRDTPPKI